jgi:predicted enzyme related to lactoylglutathione lyase
MPTQETVAIGSPCWVDLGTSDIARAKDFYSQLFGWTSMDTGDDFGNYHILSKDGVPVGGMMQMPEDQAEQGSAWTIYFGVENAAETIEKATAAGGQSLFEPIAVGDLGTMGLLFDTTGSAVGIWQPNTFNGFGLWGEAGAPCWFELMTRDIDGAATFYSTVFGPEVVDMDMGLDAPAYKTLNVDGDEKGGLFDMNGVVPDEVPPYWSVYFGVRDLDEAVRFVREQGGEIITEPADSPYGPWATVSDPLGAVFVLMGV